MPQVPVRPEDTLISSMRIPIGERSPPACQGELRPAVTTTVQTWVPAGHLRPSYLALGNKHYPHRWAWVL